MTLLTERNNEMEEPVHEKKHQSHFSWCLDYNVRTYNAARFLAESLTALRNCAESRVVFKCFAVRCIATFVTSKYVRITNALSFQF